MAAINIGTVYAVLELVDEFSGPASTAHKSLRTLIGGLTELTDLPNRVSAGLQTLGTKLTTRVTLPMVGLATVAVTAGVEFERSMNRISAVLDPTTDDLARLRATAMKMGQDTVFSATDAADALAELGKAGFSTEKAIDGLGPVLQLAAASGISMAEAAEISARTLNAFGLEVKDLTHVNDVLAIGVNRTTAEIQDFVVAFRYVGPIARSFGLSLEQTSAALALMVDNGIAASTAGRGLREALERMAKPVKATQEVMAELGIETFMSGDVLMNFADIIDLLQARGLTAVQALSAFGDTAGPAMYALVSQGRAPLVALTGDMEQAQGTAQKMADAMMKGLPGAFEQLRGAIESVRIAITTALEPALLVLLRVGQVVLTTITFLVQQFNRLPEPIRLVAGLFLLWVAAIGPLVFVLGKLVGLFIFLAKMAGINTLIGLFSGTAGSAATNAGFLANALRLLSTGLSTVWGWAVRIVTPFLTWNNALIALRAVLGYVMNVLTGAAGLIGRIALLFAGPAGWAAGILATTAALYAFFTQTESGRKTLEALWNIVQNLAIGIGENLSIAWETAKSVFRDLEQGFFDVVDAASRALGTFGGWVKDRLLDIGLDWDALCSEMANLWGKLVDTLKNLWSGFKGWLKGALKSIGLDWDEAVRQWTQLTSAPARRGPPPAPIVPTAGGVDTGSIWALAQQAMGDPLPKPPPPPLTDDQLKAAQKMREEIEKMTAALSGAEAVKDAEKLLKAVAGITDALGPNQKLEIADTMDTLVAKLNLATKAGHAMATELMMSAEALRTIVGVGGLEFGPKGPGWAGYDLMGGPGAVNGMPYDQWGNLPGRILGPDAPPNEIPSFFTDWLSGFALPPEAAPRAPGFFGTAFGSSKDFGFNIASTVMGALQGGGNVGAAVGGSIGGQLLGGLATTLTSGGGIAIGGALGGVLNAVLPGLGSILGSLAGQLLQKLFKSDATRAVEELGREWGVSISQEMGEQIEATMKSKFKGMRNNRWMAEVFNLGDIIEDAGGVTAENFESLASQMHQAFVFASEGAFSSGDVAHVLDEAFPAFVEFAEKAGGALQPAMVNIIKLARETGVQSKAVLDYVRGQLEKTGAGFAALAANFTGPFNDDLEETLGTGGQDRFDRFGRLAMTTFAAMQASGMTLVQTLTALGPALDLLSTTAQNVGFQTAAFGELLQLRGFMEAHPAIVGAMDGLNQMLLGFHNSAFMTQQVFTDLGLEAAAVFQDAVNHGLTADQALRMMQPSLQRLWELQQLYGFSVDASTQALINQGLTAGIVGEQHRSAQDRIAIATERVATTLEAIATHLGVTIPAAADVGAAGVRDAFDGLSIDVPVHFNVDGMPLPDPNVPAPETMQERMHRGGVVPQYRGVGGLINWAPRGTDTVPAMLTPGEGIVSVAGMDRLGSDGLRAINSGAGLGGDGGTPIYLSLNIDGRTWRQIMRDEGAPIVVQAIADNHRGTKTLVQRATAVA